MTTTYEITITYFDGGKEVKVYDEYADAIDALKNFHNDRQLMDISNITFEKVEAFTKRYLKNFDGVDIATWGDYIISYRKAGELHWESYDLTFEADEKIALQELEKISKYFNTDTELKVEKFLKTVRGSRNK